MSTDNVSRVVGRVKWFNNKAGYGFITVTDGEKIGTDIFVHHSAVNVDGQQYKYLVLGEYVEFSLTASDSDKYEFQASNVSGIKGGKLMCETRHDTKVARTEYKSTKNSEIKTDRKPLEKVAENGEKVVKHAEKVVKPRARGGGPRDLEQQNVWTTVGEQKKRGRPRKVENTKSA